MSGSENIGVKLLLNPEGELRCGWRVLAFFFALIVLVTLLAAMMGALGLLAPGLREVLPGGARLEDLMPHKAMIALGTERTMLLAATLAASALCARLLERRSFGSIGYKFHQGWARDFTLGSALGAATLCIAVIIATVAGSMSFVLQSNSISVIAINFVGLFSVFLIAAAFEEALIRGFAFQAIAHNLGPVVALVGTSVLFGAMHLGNENVTSLSTINTTLAGIWLGAAYFATRSLWLATALHYAWNLVMAFVFGLPVSGFTIYKSLAIFDGRGSEPVWVSGGDYGPEGGVAATVALIISTLIVWKSGLFKPSEDMLAAIKHNSLDSSANQSQRIFITKRENETE